MLFFWFNLGKLGKPQAVCVIIVTSHFYSVEFYTWNFMNKKKPQTKKAKIITFTDLVKAMNSKSNFSDNSGKGVVKGKDVSRIKDFLDQK